MVFDAIVVVVFKVRVVGARLLLKDASIRLFDVSR